MMLRRLTFARATHTLLIAAALVVSLTPLRAADFAKVLAQSGRVSIIKDTSGYGWPMMDTTLVNPGYTIKTGVDGYAKLQVSDGSTFEVFPNSEVVFRKTNSIGDLLNVWLGKVKVMIQHAPGIPNPNNVTTPTALISVRGTVFDVDVEDEDGTTFVALDEGIVDVHHLVHPSRDVRLLPGGSIRVFRDQPLAALGIDKGNIFRNALKAVQQAVYQGMINRPGGVAGGNVPGTSGKQGDNGKNTGNTGNGNGVPANGAPPNPPPPPPPPPGGGGG
jgi:ferric-dicitrate binding protein FerR (iron transport regulator)